MDNKIVTPTGEVVKPQDTPKAEENSASIKVSTERPEVALLQGGLFVVAIPLNSKVVDRIIAYGALAYAKERLERLFYETDLVKARARQEAHGTEGGIIAKAKAAIDSAVSKFTH